MTKELAIKQSEVAEFRLFAEPDLDVKEIVEDNMGGERFNPSDLTRIPMPAAGGTTFQVPTTDGEVDMKKIPAIIVHVQPARLYWEKPFGSGEVTPPNCFSPDLLTGIGNPGGKCNECPMNEFRSGKDGVGKACTERRNLYILTKDTLLPYNLSAPVQSIKNYKAYLQNLTRSGISVKNIVTIIGLEKDKSQGGIAYSKLTFEAGPPLTLEQKQMIAAFRSSFSTVMEQTKMQNAAAFDVRTECSETSPDFAEQ